MASQTAGDIRNTLLQAALPHVAFDGWTPATWDAAVTDAGIAPALATGVCPRGALDLAVAYHRQGDAQMTAALADMDLTALRYRDRVARAIQTRLDVVGMDKEPVRRGSTLFALPHHASEGAHLIWGTADAIWTALGDTSDDVNWYTKRATLSAVYGATVLFWLGDMSEDGSATTDFIERRIDNVMQIETLKAKVRETPALQSLLAGPNWLMSRIKAPNADIRKDMPGHTSTTS